jgi:hypothetical protein
VASWNRPLKSLVSKLLIAVELRKEQIALEEGLAGKEKALGVL